MLDRVMRNLPSIVVVGFLTASTVTWIRRITGNVSIDNHEPADMNLAANVNYLASKLGLPNDIQTFVGDMIDSSHAGTRGIKSKRIVYLPKIVTNFQIMKELSCLKQQQHLQTFIYSIPFGLGLLATTPLAKNWRLNPFWSLPVIGITYLIGRTVLVSRIENNAEKDAIKLCDVEDIAVIYRIIHIFNKNLKEKESGEDAHSLTRYLFTSDGNFRINFFERQLTDILKELKEQLIEKQFPLSIQFGNDKVDFKNTKNLRQKISDNKKSEILIDVSKIFVGCDPKESLIEVCWIDHNPTFYAFETEVIKELIQQKDASAVIDKILQHPCDLIITEVVEEFDDFKADDKIQRDLLKEKKKEFGNREIMMYIPKNQEDYKHLIEKKYESNDVGVIFIIAKP